MTDKLKSNLYSGDSTEKDQEQSYQYTLLRNTGSKTEDIEPEIRLWRAVVIQAVVDAASADVKKRLAVALWMHEPDFSEVCDLSGITESKLYSRLEEIFCSTGAKAKYLSNILRDDILMETKEVY